MHPHQRSFAADWALRHLSRTIAASALVAAWHRSVRLGVDEADNARCLATDGRFGSLQPARIKMRVGERYHGRQPFGRARVAWGVGLQHPVVVRVGHTEDRQQYNHADAHAWVIKVRGLFGMRWCGTPQPLIGSSER